MVEKNEEEMSHKTETQVEEVVAPEQSEISNPLYWKWFRLDQIFCYLGISHLLMWNFTLLLMDNLEGWVTPKTTDQSLNATHPANYLSTGIYHPFGIFLTSDHTTSGEEKVSDYVPNAIFGYSLCLNVAAILITWVQNISTKLSAKKSLTKGEKILQTLTSWHCRYILGVWGTVFAIFLLILGILIKVKALSIIAICLVGLFTSFFQACIYGLGGASGEPRNMVALASGNGISGIAAVVICWVPSQLAANPVGLEVFGIVLFCIAAASLVLAYSAYFTVFLQNKKLRSVVCIEEEEGRETLLEDVTESHALESGKANEEGAAKEETDGDKEALADNEALESEEEVEAKPRGPLSLLWALGGVMSGMWVQFIFTFAVFPTVCVVDIKQVFTSVDAQGNPIKDQVTFTILSAVFQIFDLAGRWVCDYKGFILTKRATLIGVYLRVIFVIMFLLGAFYKDAIFNEMGKGYYFTINLILVALFSFTNGWFATNIFMKAPGLVESKVEKEKVGSLLAYCLINGIFVGSILSRYMMTPWVKYVTGSD